MRMWVVGLLWGLFSDPITKNPLRVSRFLTRFSVDDSEGESSVRGEPGMTAVFDCGERWR